MALLLGGILFLFAGYFLYGALVERVVGTDDRPTPAVTRGDGVDFVPLPKWKNLMIQLLNIAGIGPVIGVIAGIKFGRIALVIIPVGCVLMGAVHDFLAGVMSLRYGGANLPAIVRRCLGRGYASVFAWFMVVLLLLVVAVFINVPANLIDRSWFPSIPLFWLSVGAIFVYYVAATLFPVDKIIGRIYPIFGMLLIVGSVAVLLAVLWTVLGNPALLEESAQFRAYHDEVFNSSGRSPVFPLLFVTIACGIISGFHATQSPIVARTMRSEREARLTFYGMMIAEGVIAMIWAAAALAIYNDLTPLEVNGELTTVGKYNLTLPPAVVLGNITTGFLGSVMGGITVLAVVILAITSGDTALRSARLSLAEMMGIDQAPIVKRILITLPLIVLVALLLWWSNADAKSFGHLWNYFSWCNQVLAATTLMAGVVWLWRQGKRLASLIALLPGMFMTSVVVAFICWTSADKGQPWGLVPGGLPLSASIAVGVAVSVVFAAFSVWCGHRQSE